MSDLQHFTGARKLATQAIAERLVGRVGRLAQIVPTTRPFAGALFAALTASKRASASSREAPPGMVAVKRFRAAATWFRTLLSNATFDKVLLKRDVWARTPAVSKDTPWTIEIDASPWGGGGVLLESGTPREWFSTRWTNKIAPGFRVTIGESAHQTFWEFYNLLLALILWASRFRVPGLQILGDNTRALADVLKLSGKGAMMAIAREVSWRQVRGHWVFEVGHLPGEHNVLADALSRLHDPDPAELPSKALKGALRRLTAEPGEVWACQPKS
jgi:hypothetical protein